MATARQRRAPAKTKYVQDSEWHITRNIPVALIVTLFFQAAGLVYWGSGVTNDIRELKDDVEQLTLKTERSKEKLEEFRVTAEKLTTVMEHQSKTLVQIREDIKEVTRQIRHDRIRRETRAITPRTFRPRIAR